VECTFFTLSIYSFLPYCSFLLVSYGLLFLKIRGESNQVKSSHVKSSQVKLSCISFYVVVVVVAKTTTTTTTTKLDWFFFSLMYFVPFCFSSLFIYIFVVVDVVCCGLSHYLTSEYHLNILWHPPHGHSWQRGRPTVSKISHPWIE